MDTEQLRALAAEAVVQVAAECDVTLDGRLTSLDELDDVCERLLSEGPLTERELTPWYFLFGAYVGEVVLATHGGRWIEHELAPGVLAITVNGATGFPFSYAYKVLTGEPTKSFGAFGRVFPQLGVGSPQS